MSPPTTPRRGPPPAAWAPPPGRGEASTHLLLHLVSEVVHRLVDNRGTRAFGDRVPSAQDPSRPGVVALEHRRGGERDQRVHERELVMELPDMCEAFPHQRDRLIGVPAPHRQEGAKIQRPRQEPRRRRVEAPRWPHRAGAPRARRRRSPGRPSPSRSANSRAPTGAPAPGILQRRGRSARGPRPHCRRECSMSPNRFSARATITMSPVSWASARARVSAVRASPSSPCVYRIAPVPSSALDSTAGGRRAGSGSGHTTGCPRPRAHGCPRRRTNSTRCRMLRPGGRDR